ncbi:MAG: hypothetical protein CMP65_01050 [Flavobacteriales bacterium]|nr:hypothetical protein [Flavobacteriales bacterium]
MFKVHSCKKLKKLKIVTFLKKYRKIEVLLKKKDCFLSKIKKNNKKDTINNFTYIARTIFSKLNT